LANSDGTALQTKKSGWIGKTLISLFFLVFVLGAVFYWRPSAITSATQQMGMWANGIHQNEVQLGSYRIHYLASGDNQGRPLVLVHGLGGRSLDWLGMIPQFTKSGFKVYAPDLLGFGKSDKPDVDYSISLQTDILRQFLDSQSLQQADIVGWSMGGWISLKFAAENPQRVHRLSLLDSAGMRFEATNATALLPTTTAELAHMMEILNPNPPAIPSFVARDILRELVAQAWVVRRALVSMGTGKDLMDGKLQDVKMPVLIVWGKEDVLTPLSVGEAMHREMPQSILYVVNGCGHLAPTRCQDNVVPEMQKFLAQ